MVVGVSEKLWIWDQIPLRQAQHSYRYSKYKSSFISDYDSSRVIVRVAKRANGCNLKVVGKLTDLVNPFR